MKNKCICCKHLCINSSTNGFTIGRQTGKTILSMHNMFGCKKIKENIGVYIYYDEIAPCLVYKEGD